MYLDQTSVCYVSRPSPPPSQPSIAILPRRLLSAYLLLRDTAQAIALFVDEPAAATGEIFLVNLIVVRIRTSPSCVGAREGRGGAVGGDLSGRQKGAR